MCDTLTDEGFMEAVVKLPLHEHLEVSYCSLSEEDFLKTAGQSCPNLKTLKLNSEPQFKPDDDEALAIAETMPGLRHLQLYGNGLTNKGLNAILDAYTLIYASVYVLTLMGIWRNDVLRGSKS